MKESEQSDFFSKIFLDVEHLKIVVDRFGGSWYTCIIRKRKERKK